MKRIHLLFGILATLLFCSFLTPKAVDNNYIEMYFSRNLDINDLVKMKSELSSKNIQLNYSSLGFDNNGKLLKINYNVVTNKFSGSDKSEDLNEQIGFIICTDPNPKYGIIVGKKEYIEKRRLVLEDKK